MWDADSSLCFQRSYQAKVNFLWNSDSLAKTERVGLFPISVSQFSTSHPREVNEPQRGGIAMLRGSLDRASFPEVQSCTDGLWPTQTVSVCKFNMRTFYFFKANVFILLAIVSIVAFRIRWFNIPIQRSWGGFVYLFVVKSLTPWSDIYTTPQSKGIRQVTCLPFLINTNNSLFTLSPIFPGSLI